MKIKTFGIAWSSMLYSRRTYDDPVIDIKRDEIVSAEPSGTMSIDGIVEDTVHLYLKNWKDGARPNYSPDVACTVTVRERDLAKEWPDLGKELKDARVFLSRQPDPDHGSCS